MHLLSIAFAFFVYNGMLCRRVLGGGVYEPRRCNIFDAHIERTTAVQVVRRAVTFVRARRISVSVAVRPYTKIL